MVYFITLGMEHVVIDTSITKFMTGKIKQGINYYTVYTVIYQYIRIPGKFVWFSAAHLRFTNFGVKIHHTKKSCTKQVSKLLTIYYITVTYKIGVLMILRLYNTISRVLNM